MRLLIIEDDRDSADYLVKAFREVGHVADLATGIRIGSARDGSVKAFIKPPAGVTRHGVLRPEQAAWTRS